MALKMKKKYAKNQPVQLTPEEQRSFFPSSLVEAFLNASNAKWKDHGLYEEYKKEAVKYLGEEKSKDRIELGCLTVKLTNATSDIKKKKLKKSNNRNLHAVNAHFRNSAGPILDSKKQKSKQLCRQKVDKEEE